MTAPSQPPLAVAVQLARADVHAGNPSTPEVTAALLAGLAAQTGAIAQVRSLAADAVEDGTWTVAVAAIDSALVASNTGGM
jgi:hypothetical protein